MLKRKACLFQFDKYVCYTKQRKKLSLKRNSFIEAFNYFKYKKKMTSVL